MVEGRNQFRELKRERLMLNDELGWEERSVLSGKENSSIILKSAAAGKFLITLVKSRGWLVQELLLRVS